MDKMAIIGDTESVLAFQAVGMDAYMVTQAESENVLKKQFRSKKYAVIFLAESLAEGLAEFLKEIGKIPLPAVTIIPLAKGKKDIGLNRMKKICIHATGTDIISKEQKNR